MALSFVIFFLSSLLLHLCHAVPAGEGIGSPLNSTAKPGANANPWPQTPFDIALSGGRGGLRFNDLAEYASDGQSTTFHAMMNMLQARFSLPWPYIVITPQIVLPDTEGSDIASFVVGLKVVTSIWQPSVRVNIARQVLSAVEDATQRLSVRSLTAGIIGIPAVQGGLAIELRPHVEVNRDLVPILLTIPSAPVYVVEIISVSERWQLPDLEPVFDLLMDQIDHRIAIKNPNAMFTGCSGRQAVSRGRTIHFAMQPLSRVAPPSLNNDYARRAVDTLTAFFTDFEPGDLSFKVSKVLGTTMNELATGRIFVDYGNDVPINMTEPALDIATTTAVPASQISSFATS